MWQYLIITADESLRAQIVAALQSQNVAIDHAASLTEARQRIAAAQYHLLILDDNLLNEPAAAAVKFGETNPPLILLTTAGDAAVRPEAEWTVLPKPVDPQALRNAAQAMRNQAHLQNSIDYLRHREPYIYDFSHITPKATR